MRALAIRGEEVTVPELFRLRKDDVLYDATLIEYVNDPETHDQAVLVQRDLRECRTRIESSRKEIKAPVIKLGKLIDAVAATEDKELEVEENRIQSLVNDFQALELAKARAAENARRLEEERLERERQAELRRLQEIEDAKRRVIQAQESAAALAAQQARNAAEAEAAASLQREIQRQKELADAESIEKLEAIHEKFNDAAAALPRVEMHRAEGQRVVEDWEIVVTDIWALARAHPACVKIEPRLSEIKAMLKLGQRVAGVTAKPVVKSTTTAQRAIDV